MSSSGNDKSSTGNQQSSSGNQQTSSGNDKPIMVTGATGKQGGAVVDALLALNDPTITILAVTRNPESEASQKLMAKSKQIRLIRGDLNNTSLTYENAKFESPNGKIWGVFSVQTMSMGVKVEDTETAEETKQGMGLIDGALANDVKMFVYTSVDRGGAEKSWDNPTSVPHFRTKYLIERYLRSEATGRMNWTILRPVIFMDNIENNLPSKIVMTAIKSSIGNKSMPWIATKDIGFFAAQAFADTDKYNGVAISLAGDELTFDQLNEKFKNFTGHDVPTTFSFVGSALNWLSNEMGQMCNWFRDEGYFTPNLPELRSIDPHLLDFDTWLRQDSDWSPQVMAAKDGTTTTTDVVVEERTTTDAPPKSMDYVSPNYQYTDEQKQIYEQGQQAAVDQHQSG